MEKMNDQNFCQLPVWYPALAEWTFPTLFVRLQDEVIKYLAADDEERGTFSGEVIAGAENELAKAMKKGFGLHFISVDCCSLTDTERFETKGGSIHSAESAWKYICASEKVRQSAKAGKVKHICIKPYRNITLAREFRLFIVNGKLAAMSQYNLLRHYFRLDGVKDEYLKMAEEFVASTAWKIPLDKVVVDIYITSSNKIMVVDLNPWGEPTDPLLLKTWERDWSVPAGICLMDLPRKISGDVNVSF